MAAGQGVGHMQASRPWSAAAHPNLVHQAGQPLAEIVAQLPPTSSANVHPLDFILQGLQGIVVELVDCAGELRK